ncbi:MAG: peptidoglycan-binding domain-containing protein, partial [bacterium]|nr:peptidoglycan-binding domain-containing protein [bacterium]
MVKKLVGVILFAAIILPASSASAQGLTDQINLLLTRISELQEQVKNLQSQQTSQGAVNREGSSDGTTDANVRFTTDLYYRMPGQPHVQVRALQEILVTKGFLIAPEEINVVNGYFGPLTLTAVQAFQREYDIFPSNGFVGPLTRAVLHRIFYDPGAGRGSDTGSTDPKQNEIDALP